MSKLIFRAVAILLIPCLITDSAQAVYFPNRPFQHISSTPFETSFQQQALTLSLREVIPSIILSTGQKQKRDEALVSRGSGQEMRWITNGQLAGVATGVLAAALAWCHWGPGGALIALTIAGNGLAFGMSYILSGSVPAMPQILRHTTNPSNRDGKSLVTYLTSGTDGDIDSIAIRDQIVDAQNRWQVAKWFIPVTRDDIASIKRRTDDPRYIDVIWNRELTEPVKHMTTIAQGDRAKMAREVRQHTSATKVDASPMVFVNGMFAGVLNPDTVEIIARSVAALHSVQLVMRQDPQRGVIDIRFYFSGRPRDEELFDHMMDCLNAIERPVIINDDTIGGESTLMDWYMNSPSHQYITVEDKNGQITMLRPQGGLDQRSDRTVIYKEGRSADDDRRIAIIRESVTGIREMVKQSKKGRSGPPNSIIGLFILGLASLHSANQFSHVHPIFEVLQKQFDTNARSITPPTKSAEHQRSPADSAA